MNSVDFSDRVLLTIHGVTSTNDGLARLRSRCEKALPGIICDSYFYGEVVPFDDLSEEVQHFISRSIKDKLELVSLKYLNGSGKKLFVVAHSFGTLALIRALQMHVPGLSLSGLILLGSVVPRLQPWDGMVESGQLAQPPLAIIRPLDRVVRFGRLVGGGESGAKGFIAMGRHLAIETYKNGGHTAYYPDDCDDVVTYIRDGIAKMPLVTFDEWKAQAGSFRRFRLRLF
jgi:hypothetical protein